MDLIKKLNDLAQVDIDAYHAYSQAIDAIKDNDIQDKLRQFQQDHEKHIDNLSMAVKKLGGEPISFSRDFKGFLITGYTAIRSMTGDIGALKAMDTNEKITNKSYDDMLNEELPADIYSMIEKHDKDEKQHLAYIKKKLQDLE